LSVEDGGPEHNFIVSHQGVHYTSAVLFFRKVGEPRPNAAWDLFCATLKLAPGNLLAYMAPTDRGERDGTTMRSARGTKGGAFMFGPYLALPAGRYRLRCRVLARSGRWWAAPMLPVMKLEVVAGTACRQLALRSFSAPRMVLRSVHVDFVIPPELAVGARGCGTIQFRFFKAGGADLVVEAMELSKLADAATG